MDTFTQKDYNTTFIEFCRVAKHDDSITTHLSNILSKFISNDQNKTYFEIGPGAGLYLYNIGLTSLFTNIVLCEPNADFINAIKGKVQNMKKYQMTYLNKKFLEVNDDELQKFDICIKGHVIYYLSDEEIKITIDKLKKFKKTNLSRIVFSFGTNDANDRFGFNKIPNVKINVPDSINEVSKYIISNETTLSHKYYKNLIQPLVEETFELDIEEKILNL